MFNKNLFITLLDTNGDKIAIPINSIVSVYGGKNCTHVVYGDSNDVDKVVTIDTAETVNSVVARINHTLNGSVEHSIQMTYGEYLAEMRNGV